MLVSHNIISLNIKGCDRVKENGNCASAISDHFMISYTCILHIEHGLFSIGGNRGGGGHLFCPGKRGGHLFCS